MCPLAETSSYGENGHKVKHSIREVFSIKVKMHYVIDCRIAWLRLSNRISLREMRIVTHDCVKLCVWFLVAGPSPGFSSRVELSWFHLAIINIQLEKTQISAKTPGHWRNRNVVESMPRGVKNQEGPKTRRGVTFFKFNIGCMQQPGGQTWWQWWNAGSFGWNKNEQVILKWSSIRCS